MRKNTFEEILDQFLEYYVKLPNSVGKYHGEALKDNPDYTLKEIVEIAGKLKHDGFIWADHETEGWPDIREKRWTSTFAGRMFLHNGGYVGKKAKEVEESEKLRLEKERHETIEEQLEINSGTLNKLTRWLAYGTFILAAMEVIKFIQELRKP